MAQVVNPKLPSSRMALFAGVDPGKLRKAAALLKAGRVGRDVDLQVHLALTDFSSRYKDWRFSNPGIRESIVLRKHRRSHLHTFIDNVPRYSTSKDALDPVVMLLPNVSISSGFESYTRIVASATYIDSRHKNFAEMKIEARKDPSVEAAARCGALLHLVALVVEERRERASKSRIRLSVSRRVEATA